MMKIKTAQAVMSLHRKQMADALSHKGCEDMLGFHYAAFRHRQLVRRYLPALAAYADMQNPEQTARDAATKVRG